MKGHDLRHLSLLQEAAPHMPKGSSVVLISSIAGFQPPIGMAMYGVTKTALFGLTKVGILSLIAFHALSIFLFIFGFPNICTNHVVFYYLLSITSTYFRP